MTGSTKVELLAPAGGMRQLYAALRFGADAVYCGLKTYGLRAYAGNFEPEEMREAIRIAHGLGKRLYVTLNIFAYDGDMDGLAEAAKTVYEMGADAAIVADIGAVSRIHREAPGLCVHVSTQANTTNSDAARVYHELGAKRIVLARELSLERIRSMRARIPAELELEVFVHGAVCMAYSGRCLLSNHMTGRDANQGQCAQTCRWKYHVVEEKRPGQYMPVETDGMGTHIFSARDLCMIGHIAPLMESGIASLKIEGRMKNEYYVATVVSAYRRAMDAWYRDPKLVSPGAPLLKILKAEVEKVSHRPYDTGFFFGTPQPGGGAEGFFQTMEFVGAVEGYDKKGQTATFSLRNRIIEGDVLEAMTPHGVHSFPLLWIERADTGERVPSYGHPGAIVRVPCPHPLEAGDILRGICRNHTRIPENAK